MDVFFVLSGFVVSMPMWRSVESGRTISLREFYQRRVKRLLPAASVMSVVTLIASAVFLGPADEQPAVAETAKWAALSLSNLHLFLNSGGYFDVDEESNALLHTWTLSVEEQFYLVLPVLFVVAGWLVRRGRKPERTFGARRATLALVLVGSLVSLSAAILLSGHFGNVAEWVPAADRFAFYLPVTRAWEFGVGVLFGAIPSACFEQVKRKWRSVIAFGGCIAIVGSAFLFDGSTAFPGYAAMLPVGGTAALLAAGAGGPTMMSPILDSKPAQWIGDRSYGWYLWHWPAIVIANAIWPHQSLALIGAAIASLPIAAFSLRFIEQPVRLNDRLVGWRVMALAVTCIASSFAAATALSTGADRYWGLDLPEAWVESRAAVINGCGAADDIPVTSADCRFGDGTGGTVVVVGDSHAASIAEGVTDAAAELNLDVVVTFKSNCPFLMGVAPAGNPDCLTWQQATFEVISELNPTAVVVANRSSGFATLELNKRGEDITIRLPGGDRPSTRNAAVALWRDGFTGALEQLAEEDVPVVVLDVIPEYRGEFEPVTLFRPKPRVPMLTSEALDAQRRPTIEVEHAVGERFANVRFVDPAAVLCPTGECAPVMDGDWIYHDGTHLAPNGSRLVAPLLRDAIRDLVLEPGAS